MKSIAIFASGKGSNAKNIIKFFKDHPSIEIKLLVSSHKDAGVIQVAKAAHLPFYILDKKEYYGSGDHLVIELKNNNIDGIVLAGFIWLIPEYLIELYPQGIINIHPALLPKYGGKGMYGSHVHEAVWKNHESMSGITIHEVNSSYDEGKIIFQTTCALNKEDMPDDIALKVHALEYAYYPKIIESYFNH
jgi:phosphoribosylglycinamide formyltransferase-1